MISLFASACCKQLIHCESKQASHVHVQCFHSTAPCWPSNSVYKLMVIPLGRLPLRAQFLPQDKVVEFARMDPHELLVATEKAIGDASLHDKHEELIKLCKDAKEGTLVSPFPALCAGCLYCKCTAQLPASAT